MTTQPASISATPILDLLKPLPKPDSERISGRFAVPFLAFVALIVLTGNISFLMVPFGLILIGFLATLVHELGHIIAGWTVGLRFEGVTVGPFVAGLERGRWELKLRPRSRGGLTFMGLDRVRRVRRRLIVLVAGGPASSLILGGAALYGGEFARARYDSPWPTFFKFFGVFSLFIGFLALLPIRSGRYAGDGMLLRALLFSKSDATHMIASHALASVKKNGLFPPDYFRRWWKMASSETPVQYTRFYADWLAYESAKDCQEAAKCLERCLADSAILDPEGRCNLMAEATVFNGYQREDSAKTEGWSKRVQCAGHVGPLDKVRVEVAVFYAHGQFDQALTALDRGLSMITSAPSSKARSDCENAWMAWREQIEKCICAPVT